jgi:hypothetical protein
VAEKRKKQRGLLDIVPEAALEAAAVSGGWLDPASYDPSMLSYRAGTGLRNMMAGTAALPGLLGEVGRGALQKIRELSPEDLRGRAAPRDTTVVDAASALARRVAQDPGAAASKVLDYGRGILSSPGNVVEFLGENITPRPRGPRSVMQEIDVYHGSPHRFEEFDASKIGTGEGAQAYGHGIYLAENPSVARSYIKTPDDWVNQANVKNSSYRKAQAEIVRADRELRKQFPSTIPKDEISAFMYVENNQKMFPKETIEKIKNIRKAEENAYKEFTSGSFYKADLPDKMVDRMLDWDKPLSEQSPYVQKIIGDEIKRIGGGSTHSGEQAYKELMFQARMERAQKEIMAKEAKGQASAASPSAKSQAKAMEESRQLQAIDASERLRQLGIPGIKYLDAGSRGQGGTGTRNFVVFPGEEKNVKILKRE